MHKKSGIFIIFFAVILLSLTLPLPASSAATLSESSAGRQAAQPYQPIANSQNREMYKQFARMRADMEKLMSAYRQIITRIKENESTLNALEQRLDNLEQRIGRRGGGSDDELSDIKKEVKKLSSDLEDERRQRRRADEKLVNTVSSEIATALAEFEGSAGGGGNNAGDLESRGSYTVQKGDTLSAVAKAFDVSVDDLRKINNLKSDLIRSGQQLLIPK
ncbi:MAG: LysM peptidoglycan-binding domain-containing protein [Verrucomicrobiota bacterium]